jgi:predicted membrane metal-binding protein
MARAVTVRLALAALGFALLAGAGGAQAGGASAALQVSVVVRHFFRLQVLSQPQAIQVSQRDVARGYVDVPVPVQLAVESNSGNGYSIQFARHGEAFLGAQVQGLGQEFQVDSQAAMHWQPAARRETLEFRFRLRLAPHLPPGEYPWPIQVSMNAL